MERDEQELGNVDKLVELIYLYQHEAMINYIRSDKLGVYNSALSIYFQTQIDNCNNVLSTYTKLLEQNKH